jgi:putative two-component system response regulator
VRTHIALYNQNQELARQVKEKTEELVDTRLEIIRRLGKVAEIKDNETGMHIIRMSHYTRILAEALNISDEWTELVFNAAPMHDVGKIGIPEKILLKNDKLDDEEWAIMKKHPQYGVDIIGDHHSELIHMSKIIALRHHEKWDGSGYPDGLKGDEIPLEARIVAIADVFDALTSIRPYKTAWKLESTLEYINVQSGQHFDPKLVEILNNKVNEFAEIMEQYKDKGAMNIIQTV